MKAIFDLPGPVALNASSSESYRSSSIREFYKDLLQFLKSNLTILKLKYIQRYNGQHTNHWKTPKSQTARLVCFNMDSKNWSPAVLILKYPEIAKQDVFKLSEFK